MDGPRRLGRATIVLLATAGLWAAALPVAGALLPAYSGSPVSTTVAGTGSTHAGSSSRTLLQVNGAGVLALLCVPLFAVLVVGGIMWLRRRRREPGPGALAWSITGALGVGSLVGVLTVGLFVVPVVLLLVAACANEPATTRHGTLWRSRP